MPVDGEALLFDCSKVDCSEFSSDSGKSKTSRGLRRSGMPGLWICRIEIELRLNMCLDVGK